MLDWNITDGEAEKYFGFIYKLIFIKDDELFYYIGKKQFRNNVTRLALKNGLPRENHIRFVNKRKDGHIVKYEVFDPTPDAWKDYEGSIKNLDPEMRLISKRYLKLCETKRLLTYWEVAYLFENDVLRDENYLNANISGKFFPNLFNTSF